MHTDEGERGEAERMKGARRQWQWRNGYINILWFKTTKRPHTASRCLIESTWNIVVFMWTLLACPQCHRTNLKSPFITNTHTLRPQATKFAFSFFTLATKKSLRCHNGLRFRSSSVCVCVEQLYFSYSMIFSVGRPIAERKKQMYETNNELSHRKWFVSDSARSALKMRRARWERADCGSISRKNSKRRKKKVTRNGFGLAVSGALPSVDVCVCSSKWRIFYYGLHIALHSKLH